MHPPADRIALPDLPPPPPRSGFPLIALVTPVVIAVVLWIMMDSPLALVMGFLGPVAALASWADGIRSRRRARREAIETHMVLVSDLETRIQNRAEEFRRSCAAEAPPLEMWGEPAAGESVSTGPYPVLVGRGTVASGIVLDDRLPDGNARLDAAAAGVRTAAPQIEDCPVVVHGAAPMTVSGAEPLRRAFSRGVICRELARRGPEGVQLTVPDGELWADDLADVRHSPDETWELRAEGRTMLSLRPADGVRLATIDLDGPEGTPGRVTGEHAATELIPAVMSRTEAYGVVAALTAHARRQASARRSSLPEQVPWQSGGIAGHGILAARIGVRATGDAVIDLESDGPHALVAGTTGSGKSELLISWILALAAEAHPVDLNFLLVDFKGGASFEPLAGLPHVVGVVTDLDDGTAVRAVESLRAELRRRERILADHAVRGVSELPSGVVSRLVVVVDELAALLALGDDMHVVLADVAARGRSLGMHLILCTQRPAGVVRDAVLANVTIRVCLRVLDAADSVAVVGGPQASELIDAPRGRAIIAGAGSTFDAHIALSTPSDAATVRGRWEGEPNAQHRPWTDPLPAFLRHTDVPPSGQSDALVLGAVDVPSRQRREALVVTPWTNGAVIVVGASGSGRTTALQVAADDAAARGIATRWIDASPAELWAALCMPSPERVLVLVDDIDRLLAGCDAALRGDLVEEIVRAARDTRRSQIALMMSARSGGGVMHGLDTACEHRLILRMPSPEEHLLAGGERGMFRRHRHPGSGAWDGREAQVRSDVARFPVAWTEPVETVAWADGEWAVVSPTPGAVVSQLARRGIAVAEGSARDPNIAARVNVADVDTWMADYAGLARARRSGRMLLVGCSAADHRALTRSRTPLPPLGGGDEAWEVDGGATRRVRWVIRSVSDAENAGFRR